MAEENGELVSELAALYALGCLTDEERYRVEERLRSGDIALQEELHRCRESVGQLALTVPQIRPAARLRERLMAEVRHTVSPPAGVLFQGAGLLVSSAGHMPWKRTLLPGVWTKTLFVDKTRGYRTSLVRLDPGTEYPSHRHADVEELFVIEGEFEIHGQVIGPGGYCRAEPDSVHLRARTRTGGVFLAVASVHDEFLPA